MIANLTHQLRVWLYEPIDPRPMRIFRTTIGVLCLVQMVLIWPDLEMWLSNHGVLPPDVHSTVQPSLRFTLWMFTGYNDITLSLIKVLGMTGALSLITGFYARWGAFLSWLVLSSIAWRNMYILNSGDTLLRLACFFLMFADTSKPMMNPWPQRLLQLQLCIVYFVTGIWKSLGPAWRDGSAVGTVLQLSEFQRFYVPDFLMTPVASKILTFHTLIIELGFPFLVWVPFLKIPMLVAGLALHAGLEWTLNVQLFQWIIASFYILFMTAFLPGNTDPSSRPRL